MSNIFIITSSGGGGLLQSAIAIEHGEKELSKDANIIKKDLLLDWVKGLGLFSKFFYNWTQKVGFVSLQNFLVGLNRYSDRLFSPVVFFCALYSFFHYKVDKIYNNQPIAVFAIIKALRIYNRITRKNRSLQMVFVDLPTKNYAQFLKGVKNLSQKDKKFLKIITVEPLLEGEKSNNDYWQKYCKISEKNIVYKNDLIRNAFKKYQNTSRKKEKMVIKIKTSFLQETNIIKECIENSNIDFSEDLNSLNFNIDFDDKVFFIMLGSKPASNATFEYVKNFIKIIKNFPKDKKYNLFVFCDKFIPNKKSLFSKLSFLIDSLDDYPSNLTIIPMSFQKDDVIAALLHRSDITITRSGGHTVMELLAVAKGEKWIHSEFNIKGKNPTFNQLMKGIPFWEGGNALYLIKKDSGSIVTPKMLFEKMSSFYSSSAAGKSVL